MQNKAMPDTMARFVKNLYPLILENLRGAGEIAPVVFLLHRVDLYDDYRVSIIPINTNSNADKDVAAEAVHQLAKKLQANFMIFLTEAWYITRKLDDEMTKEKLVATMPSPSQDPNRQECIVITVVERNQDSGWQSLINIQRSKHLQMPKVPNECPPFEYTEMSGRWPEVMRF